MWGLAAAAGTEGNRPERRCLRDNARYSYEIHAVKIPTAENSRRCGGYGATRDEGASSRDALSERKVKNSVAGYEKVINASNVAVQQYSARERMDIYVYKVRAVKAPVALKCCNVLNGEALRAARRAASAPRQARAPARCRSP